MSHEGLHEDPAKLSPETQDRHRAIISLMEEFEAVDWYRQRADACEDPALKAILLHNMEEEMEHAAMVLEWLRRQMPELDKNLREYLFTTGDITHLEEENTGKAESGTARPAGEAQPAASPRRFTVGDLKGD